MDLKSVQFHGKKECEKEETEIVILLDVFEANSERGCKGKEKIKCQSFVSLFIPERSSVL